MSLPRACLRCRSSASCRPPALRLWPALPTACSQERLLSPADGQVIVPCAAGNATCLYDFRCGISNVALLQSMSLRRDMRKDCGGNVFVLLQQICTACLGEAPIMLMHERSHFLGVSWHSVSNCPFLRDGVLLSEPSGSFHTLRQRLRNKTVV